MLTTLLSRIRSFFLGEGRRSDLFNSAELDYLSSSCDHHQLEAREREIMQQKFHLLRARFPG